MPKISPHQKLFRRFSDPASFQKTEMNLSDDEAIAVSSSTIDDNDIDLVNLQGQSDNLTDDNQLRRPMNAFLLFCKRHRAIVKQKHPWLDNRSCTKMLADMWAVLDPDEKNRYLQLARECKAAFMKAHPDYKWCGTSRHKSNSSACPVSSRKVFPMKDVSKLNLGLIAKEGITVGKLADPESMGGLSMLLLAGQHAMVKPESSSGSCKQEVEDEEPVSPTSTLFQLAQMCSDRLPMSVMMKRKEKEQYESKKSPNSSTKCEQSDDEDVASAHGSCKKKRKKDCHSKKRLDKKDNIKNKETSDCSKDEECQKAGSKMKGKGKKKKKSKSKEKETDKSASKSKPNSLDENDADCDDRLDVQDMDDDGTKIKSDNDQISDDESGTPRRRQSSRSCKGRLYREFVMEGMLETLQRQERPFNCKKTWRHENTTFTDEEDMIFEQEIEKWQKTGKKRRRRTISGCGSNIIDYGEINIEAKLAALPQLSMDQFRPKTKAQRSKKSAKMYKNAMFFRKDGKHKNKNENAIIKPRKFEPEIKGSRKRKAKKSAIIHLVPRLEDGCIEDTKDNNNSRVLDNEKATEINEEFTKIKNPYHKFSLTDLAEVASKEVKPCSSNIVSMNVHKPTKPSAITSTGIHRPPLMVP
ncbi:uncharacterized protein [Antedon mediterranea]|uniref:uncharacterized protein n=1 Tax=Antedon mediterranea TaxID=105859 RepID=UPI003AF74732